MTKAITGFNTTAEYSLLTLAMVLQKTLRRDFTFNGILALTG